MYFLKSVGIKNCDHQGGGGFPVLLGVGRTGTWRRGQEDFIEKMTVAFIF